MNGNSECECLWKFNEGIIVFMKLNSYINGINSNARAKQFFLSLHQL